MEVERNFESYRPPLPPLKPESQMLDEDMNTPIGYKKEGIIDALIQKAAASILKSIETITGPLYSFERQIRPTPLSSQKIVNYLHRENIVSEPKLFFLPPYNDEPKLHIISLKNNPSQETINKKAIGPFMAFGASFHAESATAKAIGEFLERYFLLPLKIHRFEKASAASFKKRGRQFLDPQIVANFSEEQKVRNRDLAIDERSEFLWVEGKNFPGEKRVMLPAQTIFWHDSAEYGVEKRIREPNTNGAAGMFTKESAILAGLEELIQRDGFLIFWLNTIPPPRIDPESIDDAEIKTIVAKIKRYNMTPTILDITTDIGLPSFAAVIADGEGGRGNIAVGGGGEAITERGIKKAL